MERHFKVEVGFNGYIGASEIVDVYVNPEREFYWEEDDLEQSLRIFIQDPTNGIAYDLLNEDDIDELGDGTYEVTYSFSDCYGCYETYEVDATDEDDAIDQAFQYACDSLTVESYKEVFDTVNSSRQLRRIRRNRL